MSQPPEQQPQIPLNEAPQTLGAMIITALNKITDMETQNKQLEQQLQLRLNRITELEQQEKSRTETVTKLEQQIKVLQEQLPKTEGK